METGKKELLDNEIQKALDLLDEISNTSNDTDSLFKSLENDENKQVNSNLNDEAIELIKSMQTDFNSKLSSLGKINRFLVDENETVKSNNEQIIKSLGETNEKLSKVSELIEQMANSPINKLGSTLTKSIQIEKFAQESGGKRVLSLSRDKRTVLGMLEKALNTEEGARRLGNVIGLIENSYVDQSNFSQIQKSVENEIGSEFKITY